MRYTCTIWIEGKEWYAFSLLDPYPSEVEATDAVLHLLPLPKEAVIDIVFVVIPPRRLEHFYETW